MAFYHVFGGPLEEGAFALKYGGWVCPEGDDCIWWAGVVVVIAVRRTVGRVFPSIVIAVSVAAVALQLITIFCQGGSCRFGLADTQDDDHQR
jgi:hypothetical protein